VAVKQQAQKIDRDISKKKKNILGMPTVKRQTT
jgi:hypothetical protein